MLAKAEAIARGAGQVLLEKTRTGFEIEYKGTIDPVTDADRAAEDFAVSELQRLFPQHSIMAEEGGFTARSEEYVWVIDPLDALRRIRLGNRSPRWHHQLRPPLPPLRRIHGFG